MAGTKIDKATEALNGVRDELTTIVSGNLRDLVDELEWSQAKLAKETGVAEGTISNYLKGERLAPLEFLTFMCMNDKLKKLELTVERLTSKDFNAKELVRRRSNSYYVSDREVKHADFLGNYICYFFDQSKPVYNQDHRESRELRYGVVSVFDAYESLIGDVSIRAVAAFFKEEDADLAYGLKRKLDSIFKDCTTDRQARNSAIENAFTLDDIAAYKGAVKFSDRHTFISVESDVYGDNALIILYSPQKKMGSEYIGGMGSVASIARGRAHVPAAQKIIMSKYELSKGCNELIAEKLRMTSAEIVQENEAETLCKFCLKLCQDPAYSMQFDEHDKAALIRRRLEQLVKNYIEKNVCCIGVVTENDDMDAYRLIEKYKI